MSQTTPYTPFQRHLLFFCTPTQPPRLTLLSALRASTALGLNFPISLLLAFSLRILYAPYPSIWSPIYLSDIPQSAHRTQLSTTTLPPNKPDFSRSELLSLLGDRGGRGKGWIKHKIDQGHIVGFWTMAADAKTHRFRKDDVERFQQGEWETEVVKRRRGRGDVLPLWRGGPGWVAGHSWAVERVVGVKVYQRKGE